MQKLCLGFLGLSFLLFGAALISANSLPFLLPYLIFSSCGCIIIFGALAIIDSIKTYNKNVNDKRTEYEKLKKNVNDQKLQKILQRFDSLISHAYPDPGHRLEKSETKVNSYFLQTADIHLTLKWILKKTKQLINAPADKKKLLITKINGKIDDYENNNNIKLKRKIHNYEIESDFWKDPPSM